MRRTIFGFTTAALLIGHTSAFGLPGVVINEIDADTPSVDTMEFVELYDGGLGNTPLDNLTVVFFNGNGDTSYDVIDLDGFSTDGNGFFLLGNAALSPDITFGILQNGADAVALYAGDFAGGAVTTLNLLDAIVYDTNDADDNGLLVGLGQSTQYNEGGLGDKDTDSIGRLPNATGNFLTLNTPTPRALNIPEPGSMALLGLAGLAILRRRR